MSSFIWLLTSFSKEYSSTLSYSLIYDKIPQNKLLQNDYQIQVKITLKGTGFQLISEKLSSRKLILDVPKLSQNEKSEHYFLINNRLNEIQTQIKSNLSIVNFDKDTILLNLSSLATKTIFIKPVLDISYHAGYDLIDNIKIEPESLSISGSNSDIGSLNFLKTETLVLNDVKEDFSENIKILIPKGNNLKVSEKNVTISAKIDRFTEGTLKIPYTITNLPDSIKLTTLQKEIEIKYVVPLKKFNTINKELLKVECDYLESINNDINYLIPKLISKPKQIKSFRILPSKIDFLIRK